MENQRKYARHKLRQVGEWLSERISQLRVQAAGYLLWLVALSVFLYCVYLDKLAFSLSILWPYALILLVPIGYVFHKIYLTAEQIERYYQGKEGELCVAEILDPLKTQGCQILPDIQAEGFNIDLLAISTKGIYAIEVKNPTINETQEHIKYDGRDVHIGDKRLFKSPVSQVISSAVWLYRELQKKTGRNNFFVKPVVLFPTVWFVEPMNPETKKKVWILNAKAFLSFFEAERPHLSEEDVSLFAQVMGSYRKSKPKEF